MLAYVVDITSRRAAEGPCARASGASVRCSRKFPALPCRGLRRIAARRLLEPRQRKAVRLYRGRGTGARSEELIIPEPMRDDVIRLHDNWLENDVAIPAGELDLLRKDGSLVPVFSSHAMLRRPGRRPRDVLRRRRPRRCGGPKAVARERGRLRSMVVALAEGVVMFAADSTIINCNPRA